MTANTNEQFVRAIRSFAPYINAHRGRVFVIQFDGSMLESNAFTDFVHDVVLLDALGIRLVLVPGAEQQIDARLQSDGRESSFSGQQRITDAHTMGVVKEVTGAVRVEIEARLSMGLANSPTAGARISVRSGNYVTARPVGIRDGVDFQYSGEIRRVDGLGLRQSLDNHNIVLLSPVGYSPTGEAFNVPAAAVATAVAAELNAAKLLLLGNAAGLEDDSRHIIRELTTETAAQLLATRLADPSTAGRDDTAQLAAAVEACRNGVRRAHLLDASVSGALLLEAFTRDGIGTMVSADTYDITRAAVIDDVPGIIELIEPLEQDGILVRRSRDKLEQEIDRFSVMERDGAVIACAALYAFADTGYAELACLAVAPAYRKGERGDTLLARLEQHARRASASTLFVLTARTAHWFIERGFEEASVDDLPVERQQMYNLQRNSKVLVKRL
ncbi:MAG: amino-acid N-acetyltransferase [Pseudomonadota bacterium]